MTTRSRFFLAIVAVALMCAPPAGAAPRPAQVETAHLVVIDIQGQLKAPQLKAFADDAEEALRKAMAYWELPDTRGGRIALELYKEQSGRAYTVFQVETTAGGRRSVVPVHGIKDPREMVHKLTHALFPTSDKLIRNMIGIPTEARFGNPRSFPMCGYNVDAWSLAIRRSGSFIPLRQLGETHEEWGMSFQGDTPVVLDRPRQHASYAEAGSFGAFLIGKFGVGKVKAFYRTSAEQSRPWKEVFGADLPKLQEEWLRSIEAAGANSKAVIDRLADWWKKNPRTACDQASNR
jgi:hypothetical protein